MLRTSLPQDAAERRALATAVAAGLARGELWALPTETVYGIAALPGHATAEPRLRQLLRRAAPAPFSLHLAARDDLQQLRLVLPPGCERLLQRYWPGPLTLLLPAADGALLGLRLPAHDFTRAVIQALGRPIWLADPGSAAAGLRAGEPDDIAKHCGAALAGLVDAGRTPLGTPSTVLAVRDGSFAIARTGILSATEVLQTAAHAVLFVCTGNTCRSPLAMALAQQRAAKSLRTAVDRLLQHRLWFASAGTATMAGLPASDGSLLVAAERKLDLSQHQSQPVTTALLQRADQIYCLARSHQRSLLDDWPELAAKTSLLRPDQRDIADPYGGDLATYRRAAQEIDAAVAARLPDWLAQARGPRE